MTVAAITARGVVKAFPTSVGVVTAVDGFDLTLEPGQLVVLHGTSGSGKTTIVHLLAGWEQPDRGVIAWPGASQSRPSWSEVAVVPQTLALLEELTVVENITLPLRTDRHRPELDDGLAQVLDQLGLTPLLDRGVDQISVGEQQRVMIARALAAHPAVILADEPTSHQDDRNGDVIGRLLAAATDHGAACLIATRQTETTMRALGERSGVIRRHQLSSPGETVA